MKKLNYSHIFWGLLALAILTAAGISLSIGVKQSIWYDEAFSVFLSKYSWWEIVRMTSEDMHPPFYYWTLKAWTALFGSSDLAVRSLSAVCLGLSVGVGGLLTKRLFGVKTALVALPFLVFAPFLLRYGFEVRMYALASLIGMCATYVLVAITQTVDIKRRRLLLGLYALLVALGVYTLYFMAFLWIAHLLWFAWYAYTQKRRGLLKEGIAAYAGSFLLFVPWLPAFLSRADGHTMPAIAHAIGFDEFWGILTFDFLYHPPWHLSLFEIVATLFAVAAVCYLGFEAFRQVSAKERPYLVLLCVYAGVPILLFILVSHIRPIYVERYLAHIIIGGYAFIGASAGLALRSRKKLTFAVIPILLGVLVFGTYQLSQTGNFNYQRLQYPETKKVVAQLTDCKDGTTIFADGPYVAIELSFYVKDCPIYFYNKEAKLSGGYVMLSDSPLRLTNPTEQLDWAQAIDYVYYGKPKWAMPANMHPVGEVVTNGKLNIQKYERNR